MRHLPEDHETGTEFPNARIRFPDRHDYIR